MLDRLQVRLHVFHTQLDIVTNALKIHYRNVTEQLDTNVTRHNTNRHVVQHDRVRHRRLRCIVDRTDRQRLASSRRRQIPSC